LAAWGVSGSIVHSTSYEYSCWCDGLKGVYHNLYYVHISGRGSSSKAGAFYVITIWLVAARAKKGHLPLWWYDQKCIFATNYLM